MLRESCFLKRRIKRRELCESSQSIRALTDFFDFSKASLIIAVTSNQLLESRELYVCACHPQRVRVLFAQGLFRAFSRLALQPIIIQQREQQARVCQIQHVVLTDERQTLQCQQCHLAGFCAADISHAFQTGLQNLSISVGSLRDPVYIFVVVQTLDAALFLFEILENREGDVRLERQQSAIGVRKGDDALRRQEILVL